MAVSKVVHSLGNDLKLNNCASFIIPFVLRGKLMTLASENEFNSMGNFNSTETVGDAPRLTYKSFERFRGKNREQTNSMGMGICAGIFSVRTAPVSLCCVAKCRSLHAHPPLSRV